MNRKVLIVEDDVDLNKTLSKFLSLKDIETFSVYDGEEAINTVYEKHFDLVILDIKLPKCNGFEVAKKIREFSSVPIIFLTSLDSQKDVEKGFLLGGDDYIIKPFSLNELYLRIDAIYKRLYKNKTCIKINNSELLFNTKEFVLYDRKENKKIHLKNKEAKLLALFLQREGETVSKQDIFEYLYDFSETPNETSLRTFIYKLRTVLPKGSIETIKDTGYRYVGSKKISL